MGIHFYIAQVIGLLTTVVAVVSVQFKNVRHILIGCILSNVMVAVNFALLGGLSGTWICILAAFQTIMMYFLDKREDTVRIKGWLLALFTIMYIGGTCVVYQGWGDLISCICAILYVLAIIQSDARNYRKFILVNAFLWVVYDIYTMAYSSVLTHGLEVLSVLIAMRRLDK